LNRTETFSVPAANLVRWVDFAPGQVGWIAEGELWSSVVPGRSFAKRLEGVSASSDDQSTMCRRSSGQCLAQISSVGIFASLRSQYLRIVRSDTSYIFPDASPRQIAEQFQGTRALPDVRCRSIISRPAKWRYCGQERSSGVQRGANAARSAASRPTSAGFSPAREAKARRSESASLALSNASPASRRYAAA